MTKKTEPKLRAWPIDRRKLQGFREKKFEIEKLVAEKREELMAEAEDLKFQSGVPDDVMVELRGYRWVEVPKE